MSLRVCGCGSDDLENAHVTDGIWVVRCSACGCLGSHGSTKDASAYNWNAGWVVRPVGYNGSEEHKRGMWESGRRIAGLPVNDIEGCAVLRSMESEEMC